MGSSITNRYGAQFGVRAGSEIPEAFGRAGAEALTRRQATAAGLLPAFSSLALQGTLARRAEPLNYLQAFTGSRQADLDALRLATSFATQNPSPPSSNYMAGGPGAAAAGLTTLGGLAAQYPLYSNLYGSQGAGYAAAGSAGTAGYGINTPVSDINLADGFTQNNTGGLN